MSAATTEVKKRKEEALELEVELDEEKGLSEEDRHVHRHLGELLRLNTELLSAEDMAALALTSKTSLTLRRTATTALKGTPMQLRDVLTVAHFPTVRRLSLILDKTPPPPGWRDSGGAARCPQLSHLTVTLHADVSNLNKCSSLIHSLIWLGGVRRLRSLEIHVINGNTSELQRRAGAAILYLLIHYSPLLHVETLSIRGVYMCIVTQAVVEATIWNHRFPLLQSLYLGPHETDPAPAGNYIHPDFFPALTTAAFGALKRLELYGRITPEGHQGNVGSHPLAAFLHGTWDWPRLEHFVVTSKLPDDLLPYFLIETTDRVRSLGLALLAQLPLGFIPPNRWPMTAIYQELKRICQDPASLPLHKAQAVRCLFGFQYLHHSYTLVHLAMDAQAAAVAAAYHPQAHPAVVQSLIETLSQQLDGLPISLGSSCPDFDVTTLASLCLRVVKAWESSPKRPALKILVVLVHCVKNIFPERLQAWCKTTLGADLVEELVPLLLTKTGPNGNKDLAPLALAIASKDAAAVNVWIDKGVGSTLALQWCLAFPVEALSTSSLLPFIAKVVLSRRDSLFPQFVKAVRLFEARLRWLVEAMTNDAGSFWATVLTSKTVNAFQPAGFLGLVVKTAWHHLPPPPPSVAFSAAPFTLLDYIIDRIIHVLLNGAHPEAGVSPFYQYAVTVVGGWQTIYAHIQRHMGHTFSSGRCLLKVLRRTLVMYSLVSTVGTEPGPLFTGLQKPQERGRILVYPLAVVLRRGAKTQDPGVRLSIMCQGLLQVVKSTPELKLLDVIRAQSTAADLNISQILEKASYKDWRIPKDVVEVLKLIRPDFCVV